jgi:hypothetical protein
LQALRNSAQLSLGDIPSLTYVLGEYGIGVLDGAAIDLELFKKLVPL